LNKEQGILNEEVAATEALRHGHSQIGSSLLSGEISLSGLIKKALRKLDWKALKRKTVVPLLGIIICW